MKIKIKIVILSLSIIMLSCKENKKSEALVTINNTENIYIEEIDNSIDQELYTFLNRVYFARKIALENLLYFKLLEKESLVTKKDKKILEYLNIYCNIDSNSINQFIVKNHLQNGVPDLSDNLRYVSPYSIRGRDIIKNSMKKEYKSIYLGYLKKKYNVIINFPEPPLKKVNMDGIQAHYIGNMNSKITLIVISNVECEKCRNNDKTLKKVFEKYSNKIKFGYSNFSDGITISSLACEAAALQNKFWQMHDLIIHYDKEPTEKMIIEFASQLKLNMSQFYCDFLSKNISNKIDQNNQFLISKKFYATPNVVINGLIVNDPFSESSIINLI